MEKNVTNAETVRRQIVELQQSEKPWNAQWQLGHLKQGRLNSIYPAKFEPVSVHQIEGDRAEEAIFGDRSILMISDDRYDVR